MKKKIFLLSSSTFMLIFCIFSFFYFTANTNVTIEYKMYYIDHELNYYLEDNGFKNHYSVGTTCDYKMGGNYRNQGSGWAEVGFNSTKTKSKISNIYFYINNETNNLTFNLNLESTQTTKIEIYINDIKTDNIFDLSKNLTHSCLFDNSLFLKNNVNKISFHNVSDNYFYVTKVSLS